MTDHLYAVLTGDVITNVVTGTPDSVEQLQHLGAFGAGELVDLAGITPTPGLGWTREGSGWLPPEPPEQEPAGEQDEGAGEGDQGSLSAT